MTQEATVDDPRGLKRICLNCSTRFFDLNKRPIVCPQCQTEFTGEVKIKPKRGRLANDDDQASEATEADEDEDLIDEEESETVSLEEVEELDDDADDETSVLDDNLDSDLDDDLVDEDIEDIDDDEDIDVDLDEDK